MRKYGLFLPVLLILLAGCGADPETALTSHLENTAAVAVDTVEPRIAVLEVVAASKEAPRAMAKQVPTATAEPVGGTADLQGDESEEDAPVIMSLSAQKAETEHSPRSESFVEPASLDEIVEPPDDSWRYLEPGDKTEFQTYDGVRVSEEGEALLDLGDLMRLILKRDTVTQSVPDDIVEDELARIKVDFGDTPLLQRIALTLYLGRGGFLGQKTIESDPIALTTPNAVVVISGTTFFIAYDPEAGITWVGNFEGTIDVADIALQEGENLPDRQLIAIPAVRGRKYWPIDEHMTFAEFGSLIDQLGSPIGAADMISGPYLVGQYSPAVAVRSGPGTEYPLVGTLDEGEYARIRGRGRGWWQIVCPRNVYVRGTACWVSGGTTYTGNYNTDDVTPTAPEATLTPTATQQAVETVVTKKPKKDPTATPTATATKTPTVTVTRPSPRPTPTP
jgi:uncharacterized protein YraI